MGGLVDVLLDSGRDTWRHFLPAWHGRPTAATRGKPGRGPDLLKTFWSVVAAWPGAIVQNRLQSPDEAAVEGERLVFYVENQAVCVWSTLLEGDDPPVWFRFQDGTSNWVREAEPLSRFLLQTLLFEATIGCTEVSLAVVDRTLSQVADITSHFRQLPLAPWLFPTGQTRFFAANQALALVNPAGPDATDYFEVFIAGHDRSDLEFLREQVDSDWIVTDRRITDQGWW